MHDHRTLSNIHELGLISLLKASDSSMFEDDPATRRVLAAARHQIVSTLSSL